MSLLTETQHLSGSLVSPVETSIIISTPGKGQNKTNEKLIKFHVGMVGRLKIETHKGMKEQGNSKAKFLKQMPEISNSKGYFFLPVAFQIERRPSKNIYWKKQSQSCRNTEGKLNIQTGPKEFNGFVVLLI